VLVLPYESRFRKKAKINASNAESIAAYVDGYDPPFNFVLAPRHAHHEHRLREQSPCQQLRHLPCNQELCLRLARISLESLVRSGEDDAGPNTTNEGANETGEVEPLEVSDEYVRTEEYGGRWNCK